MAIIRKACKGKEFEILVDNELYDWLIQFNWRINDNNNRGRKYYAFRDAVKSDGDRWWTNRNCRRKIWMHRAIWQYRNGRELADTECIDHINNNGLDNRIVNLRPATIQQNHYNSNRSIARGIFKQDGLYRVRLKDRGKLIVDPIAYTNEADAKAAYNRLAKQYHGVYARLHSIERPEQLSLV